jgi:hypothetical protein
MKTMLKLLVLSLVALVGVTLPSAPAQAYTDQQCINAHTNPQGTVATWCHQNNWTVNAYIVVDPTAWVRWGDWQVFRHCDAEYGGPLYPCWWNFFEPPSSGYKYWFDYGAHQHYVNGVR